MNVLTIRRPDDFHVHLREGVMLEGVAPLTAEYFGRAIVMPNLDKPVLTGADANNYRNEIIMSGSTFQYDFTPLMTIQITPQTTPDMVRDAQRAGVVAGKVYPRGMTTNSENGVDDYMALDHVFAAMEEHDMRLLLHGEHPGSKYCMERERDFVADILPAISRRFPDLPIVLEHVTSAEGVEAVKALPNVAGTITVHHLFLTLDDVVGGKLKPHYFCKPLAKAWWDRDALVRAVLSGHPKFFLGTDSAPHDMNKKECDEGCAGVFTAPVALPILAEFFDQHGKLSQMESFVSEYGAEFYDLRPNNRELCLVRKPMTIPPFYRYDGGLIVPFWAGREISWSYE